VNWVQVGGALVDVSVQDGHLWGVNAAGNIYYNYGFNGSNWQ